MSSALLMLFKINWKKLEENSTEGNFLIYKTFFFLSNGITTQIKVKYVSVYSNAKSLTGSIQLRLSFINRF